MNRKINLKRETLKSFLGGMAFKLKAIEKPPVGCTKHQNHPSQIPLPEQTQY